MRDDVKELLAAIKAMAEAQKEKIRAEAEQETVGITDRAEAQIKQRRDEALARLEDQLRVESESIVGRTELDIRDRITLRKNQALHEVFERARERIAELQNAKAYKDVLKGLIHEAISRINLRDVRLRLSEADLADWKAVKADFPPTIEVVLCDGPKGTVVVETNDGTQSIDNSIETRLERAAEAMRRELVEMLFEAEAFEEKGK